MDNKTTDLSFLKINRESNQNHDSDSKKKIWIITGSAALAVAVLWGIISASSSTQEQVELGTVVMTTPAQENSLLTASGYIVAQRKAAVASKGTGRLEYLAVIEGDKVKKNQIIGRLESSDVEAALGQAKASLQLAEAGYESSLAEKEDAASNFERQKTLFAQGSISRADYDAANARNRRAIAGVSSAEANIEYGKANVRSAEVQVENTLIRAPFDGVVMTKNANVGEVISPFGAAAGSRGAIVTIADMKSLEVEADVSESNIEKIKEEQRCEIMLDAYPDKRYSGFVNKIVPTADRAKATVLTKVRFSELDDRVLPEMRAKVNFLSEKKLSSVQYSSPKLSVPISAVATRNGKKVVFVVTDESVAETAVTVGEIIGSRIEIKEGLSSGQTVVLHPSENLKNGSSVSVKK